MRTAIFVYQPTSMRISTHENDLQLCSMDSAAVSLSSGTNDRSVAPGIYKILSSHTVEVTGDLSAFDLVTTDNKTSFPPLPVRATESIASINSRALQAFFSETDAKALSAP